ncbi:universal stress protein [Arenibacter sp. 6A1]|uniref:universal stress protein n=1 Tax=Arenibacter sp. 6A1 TaxID=2720391 RepID=UPI001444C6C4|nr:universal stress protein [Arenibacter sp. 6A1]NKI26565.1 universal stress protein [Arenibacter sp. 6A1]
MKNILVPIGASEDAHETLQYAVDFAAEFGDKVYVMEVYNIRAVAGDLANIDEIVAERSREHLKRVIEKVAAKGVDITIATYNGGIIEGLKSIDKELGLDLIILAPRSNDSREELYLGNVSGKIVKRTNIPTLIVPKGTVFKPFTDILTAFKSGVLKDKRILNPLLLIKEKFNSNISLLFVKTPGYTKEDLKINMALMNLSDNLTLAENTTTYLGVLQYFETQHPDLLCVFRRKRGFFKKLWERNTIPKSEFFAPVPVLVLSVKKD